MKVYISGPISGLQIETAERVFREAEMVILTRGHEPVNPLKNGLPESANWYEHMRADIKMLVDCDAIYMVGSWWASNGARLEFDIAMKIGLLDYATQVLGYDPAKLSR